MELFNTARGDAPLSIFLGWMNNLFDLNRINKVSVFSRGVNAPILEKVFGSGQAGSFGELDVPRSPTVLPELRICLFGTKHNIKVQYEDTFDDLDPKSDVIQLDSRAVILKLGRNKRNVKSVTVTIDPSMFDVDALKQANNINLASDIYQPTYDRWPKWPQEYPAEFLRNTNDDSALDASRYIIKTNTVSNSTILKENTQMTQQTFVQAATQNLTSTSKSVVTDAIDVATGMAAVEIIKQLAFNIMPVKVGFFGRMMGANSWIRDNAFVTLGIVTVVHTVLKSSQGRLSVNDQVMAVADNALRYATFKAVEAMPINKLIQDLSDKLTQLTGKNAK